jgi:hypothetical protein
LELEKAFGMIFDELERGLGLFVVIVDHTVVGVAWNRYDLAGLGVEIIREDVVVCVECELELVHVDAERFCHVRSSLGSCTGCGDV